MQPIVLSEVQRRLATFAGRRVYLHVETTNGAYAAEGQEGRPTMAVAAYVRNVAVELGRAQITGTGPFRAGLETPGGWIYAEGLTHWEPDDERLLLAGLDDRNRLAVALQVSLTPFPLHAAERAVVLREPQGATAGETAGETAVVPAGETAGAPAAPAGTAARGTAAAPAIKRERHVLVILPHPDDETLGCGGTIALYAQAGTPVTYVCATLGEMGRNLGTYAGSNRETLWSQREKELREACRLLGVRELRLLGIRDKTVEFADRADLAARLRSLIEELQPSLVLTYHPQYSVHPDHMALGAAVVQAVASMPPDARPALQARAFGSRVDELGEPDIVIDIRPVLDIKLAAARAHRSQTEFWLKDADRALAGEREAREEMEKRWGFERYWFVPLPDLPAEAK